MKKSRKGFRVEKDVMGLVKIPSEAYYGIQTARAANNFQISRKRIHPVLNSSIVEVKLAAALSNMKCGVLEKKVGNAIVSACKKILQGNFDEQFVIDVYQTGAGTSWHMNVNEVVANVALELMRKKKGYYKIIDPHNHVNYGQSSNDVVPTALRISSIFLTRKLVSSVSELVNSLRKKGKEFKSLVKTGRTHLQDAVPITLGQEFNAWASTIEKRLKVIENATDNLRCLQIGGTAVGTGFNAHPKFAKLVVGYLRKQTKLDLKSAKNKIEETQFMSDFLDLSSALRTLVTDLNKISNDIKLLSSGPRTGLNEISLKRVEPGSSIMPSKFNPSMAEMLNMVCYQVIGNDTTIREATEAGQLELNVMTPIIAHNLLESLDILRNGVREFNVRCIKGIKANKKVLQEYYEKSPSIGALLNPIIGYDKTAEVIKEALKMNKSVKAIVVEKEILSKKVADKLFNGERFV